MDPLLQPTQQGERPQAHNAPLSAAPDAQAGQTPGPPAAPSMREVHDQARLLPHMAQPPAPAEPVRSSLPTLAIGAKRSATDAGLEADPNTDGKRVKVSHPSAQATGAMPEPPDTVAGLKRNALDAGLDEDAQPASKRLRRDEPGSLDNQGQAVVAADELGVQERMPGEAASAGDAFEVEEEVVQRPGEMSIILGNLFYSLVRGDLQAVQTWLKTPGVDVNTRIRADETPLHFAIEMGQVDIVQTLLLTPGIDINATCYGETPLHMAIENGQVDIAQTLLLTPGIDINATCYGETPLHMAIKEGQVDIAQTLLLTPGIDINATCYGETPLHMAIKEGQLDIAQALLLTPGIDINATYLDETPLHRAIENGQVDIVQALLKTPGIDINATCYGATPLHRAVKRGQVDIVQALLQTPGIDINATYWRGTALHIAIEKGQVDIVQALLQTPGIDINATYYDKAPLHMAIKKGQVNIVQALLQTPGIDINAKRFGETPLHFAIEKGQIDIVQALLQTPGIDLAAQDVHGDTALKIAVKMEVAAIIDALLVATARFEESLARHREFLAAAKAGNLAQVCSLLANAPRLDVNFRESNQTALKLAVVELHLDVVQELLATPGIVVDQNTCAEIADFAAQKGHLHLLRLMLDRSGLDVNQGNVERRRRKAPYLVTATENGHLAIVQALLAVPGIDINARNPRSTALTAACSLNHHQIAMVLAALPGIDVLAPYHYCSGEYEGYTPLMFAAKYGNLPLVRVLLAVDASGVNDDRKVDVYGERYHNQGLTSLMLAAYHGHLAVVQALLAIPGIEVDRCSYEAPYKSVLEINYPLTALSLAERSGSRQIVQALLAMPVSEEYVRCKDEREARLERARRARPKPEKKQTPEQTYRFVRQTLYPGFDAGAPLPLLLPDQQRPSWLEQKCMDVSLGTCPVTDVPFLLKSTMPLPAWCQAALANGIALGFTAGHYRSAPAPLWQTLQQGQAWLAGLAFGAKASRQDAIQLDAGICHELEVMGLWNTFLNTVETLLELKADIDGVQIDSLRLLGCAARDGDLPMIRSLVALGANIHLRSPNGDAPILAAARAGQWAACAELLSLGAMPYMVDRKGYPALFHIAGAFTTLDTATPALAKLIRYLRLKNVRFDIPVPNPDEETREENPTVLISDILVSNPEPWVLFGKDVFGVREAPLPALAAVPALPAAQLMAPTTPKADIHAMLQSADPVAAVAAWLDADPQRLHWQDADNGEGLLHLAAAAHNIGLVRLLLDRGANRRHADHAGQTAAQLLPAEYMSSHTPAVADIAALLR